MAHCLALLSMIMMALVSRSKSAAAGEQVPAGTGGASNCSANNCSVAKASSQCFGSTAMFVSAAVARCTTASSADSGRSSGLQAYFQDSVNALLSSCFDAAAAPLRVTGWG
ncbi:hypothetical protein HaLaN_21599 [Haematococcus lacustris]|uniref:Secreted protein n=1 Tax=Haematococcus lacustris TaxID=44745 RepID=A0A699ZPP1_HAELA|nr:hypothetical protein HaLaN_21599 [Haematococcus lacustris]